MAYQLSVEAEEDVIGIYIAGAEQFGAAQAERYHNNLEKIFNFFIGISTGSTCPRGINPFSQSASIWLAYRHVHCG